MILEIYSDKEKGVRDGSLLMYGAAPQQGREGAAPHVALSPTGILLSLPHHTQITRIENIQTENTE